jgi:peptide subunit release factor 1 (eRF1)
MSTTPEPTPTTAQATGPTTKHFETALNALADKELKTLIDLATTQILQTLAEGRQKASGFLMYGKNNYNYVTLSQKVDKLMVELQQEMQETYRQRFTDEWVKKMEATYSEMDEVKSEIHNLANNQR